MSKAVPRSGYEMVSGLVFFGRTLDKIRLNAAGTLPNDYNLGTGFDAIVCRFLNVDYEKLKAQTLQGGSDEEILEWCFENGRRPSADEIVYFNAYLQKRGWRDELADKVREDKAKMGLSHRDDIQTRFDVHDADEGRPPRFPTN